MYKQSYRYIDKLQSFAKGYIHTINSTIEMPPADVKKTNEEAVKISTFFFYLIVQRNQEQ